MSAGCEMQTNNGGEARQMTKELKSRKPKPKLREPVIINSPPGGFTDEELTVLEACESLARKGLIVDSGRRRWSERTQSYQIVWIMREVADKQRH